MIKIQGSKHSRNEQEATQSSTSIKRRTGADKGEPSERLSNSLTLFITKINHIPVHRTHRSRLFYKNKDAKKKLTTATSLTTLAAHVNKIVDNLYEQKTIIFCWISSFKKAKEKEKNKRKKERKKNSGYLAARDCRKNELRYCCLSLFLSFNFYVFTVVLLELVG